MNAAVVLPHTLLYGGVRRFFELGSALAAMGHTMTAYTPDGAEPEWCDSVVRVRRLDELAGAEIDLLFFTERKYFDVVLDTRASYKVFYHVRQSDRVRRIVRHRDIHVFACSTNIYRHDRFWYRVTPWLAVGGVDTAAYPPKEIRQKPRGEPFVVMAYGRLAERRKGTRLVVAACERLHRRYPDLRLLLFDTPVNPGMRAAIDAFETPVPHDFVVGHPVERNWELFHRADVFVSAEKNAGWANTVAEAMASGVPVIATRSGTLDLIVPGRTGIVVRRSVRSIGAAIETVMVSSDQFRSDLAASARRHIEDYSWRRLAARVVAWYEAMEQRGRAEPVQPGPSWINSIVR